MTDISTLISAVRPKERKDQYLILAALFALEAHLKPVSAKQITDILRLHRGGAHVPANINASLRAYTAYVSPAEKGPPLRWLLTPNGIERLRSLSGLALPTASDADSFRSDIGIVCALEY